MHRFEICSIWHVIAGRLWVYDWYDMFNMSVYVCPNHQGKFLVSVTYCGNKPWISESDSSETRLTSCVILICLEVWAFCLNAYAHTLVWSFLERFCNFLLCFPSYLDFTVHFSLILTNTFFNWEQKLVNFQMKLFSQEGSLWALKQTNIFF